MPDSSPHRRTRLIATLGPASSQPAMVGRLLDAGVDLFRLNFSHGDHTSHLAALQAVREAGLRRRRYPGLLADLQGPKIRTGRSRDDQPVMLQAGATVRLTGRSVLCDQQLISIPHAGLVSALKKNQRLLLNDGAVELRIVRSADRSGTAVAAVLNTGLYGSRKGVNVPDLQLQVPALTRKDRIDLDFICSHNVPIIALSFVRRGEDVRRLRRLLERKGHRPLLIAKIEKPEAIDRIQEILKAGDGIMVARGDLGIELSLHQLPVVQKELVALANAQEKIVIVATQMLESMIHNPLPTRAESADAANAILDGADALMLSGETAVGAYPQAAVEMLHRIACEVEQSRYYLHPLMDHGTMTAPATHALCEAAAQASHDLQDAPIVVFTRTGNTARLLAKIRPMAPIYAFTTAVEVAESLALSWNVRAALLPDAADHREMQTQALRLLLRQRRVKRGEWLLLLSGTSLVAGATNQLTAVQVGKAI